MARRSDHSRDEIKQMALDLGVQPTALRRCAQIFARYVQPILGFSGVQIIVARGVVNNVVLCRHGLRLQ